MPASDEELHQRQLRLQAEAEALLTELDLATAVATAADRGGSLALTGSYVSGLMGWRDLDIMLLVGADFSPRDVLRLLAAVVERPGVVGFDYQDERAARSPTGDRAEERYHLVIRVDRAGHLWRIDLSLWLHDAHEHVTERHERMRESITDEQRRAVLQIKDEWHRRPSYPDLVGGHEIYTAVLDDGVRTGPEFAAWLTDHGLPAM